MKRCVAYLAPELPALSATFVYNEILILEEKGWSVVPFSVHVPSSPVKEKRLASITEYTCIIYAAGMSGFMRSALWLVVSSPVRFMRALKTVVGDVFRVGCCNRTGVGLLYRFLAACRVAILLKKNSCNHLHVHFAHVPADIGMYGSMLAGIPWSFTAHANDLFERGYLIPQKIARSKFAATISEFNRRYMISQGGDRNKIHIIRCGVDSRRFVALPFKPAAAPYKIGAIGRMVEKKGFDVLLRAAAILRKKGIAFQLVIAGSGPQEHELQHLSGQFGLNDVVDFPGAISHGEVPAWLRTLDLFVLPCQQDSNGDMDGIPVVLMEAMVSGVPVVSTVISGIPELIEHGREGLLVEQKAPGSLAGAMENLLLDNALRKKMRRLAIRKVRKEFDAEVNLHRLITCFL